METREVSLEMMINHGFNNSKNFVIIDMPYGSYEKSKHFADIIFHAISVEYLFAETIMAFLASLQNVVIQSVFFFSDERAKEKF